MADHRIGMKISVDSNKFKSEIQNATSKLKGFNRELINKSKNMQKVERLSSKENTINKTKIRNLNNEIRAQKQLNSLKLKQNSLDMKQRTMFKGGTKTSGMIGGAMGVLSPYLGVAAIGATVGKGVMENAKLERKETFVGNMLGRDLTDEEKTRIRKIASDVGQNFDDAFSAVYSGLSFGLDFDETLEAMKISGKAATGGGADINTMMQAFLKTGGQSEGLSENEIMNMILGAVQVGNVDEQGVATNLGKFLPQWTPIMPKPEEAMTLYSMITKNLSPEESATAMKGLSTGLVDIFKKDNRKGISADITPELLKNEGIGGLLGVLKPILESENVAVGLAKLFPSQEARSALTGAMENGKLNEDMFQNKLDVFKTADVEKNFARATDDAIVEMQRFKNALSDVSSDMLGSKSSGIIKSGTELISNIGEDIKEDGFIGGVTGVGGISKGIISEGQNFLENNMISNLFKDITGKEKIFNFEDVQAEGDNLKVSFSDLKKPVDKTVENVFTLAMALEQATAKIEASTKNLDSTDSKGNENISENPQG